MIAHLPDSLRAIILMVVGMFFFMTGDTFLKLASGHLPLGMVVFVLGIGMTAFFAVMMAKAQDPIFRLAYITWPMAMRCLGEAIGIIGVIVAVAFSPLSTVTAIMQSLPLVLTLMGALFLKEKVGPHRIAALIMGLLGVLIIIRPGLEGFNAFASVTLIGVLGMAIRDFGTRLMPKEISTVALSFWGSVAIIATGLGMMTWQQEWHQFTAIGLNKIGLGYSFGLIIATALGTLAVSTSMRLGDVSAISPFRYIRVVFGIATGIVVFGEQVDLSTYIGSAIVVGAGLYGWVREQKLARLAAKS